MITTINAQKVERIFKAERELIEAIRAGVEGDAILVEISVDKWTSGTQTPRILVKQAIFP